MWELTRAQKVARLLTDKFGAVSRAPMPIRTLSDRRPGPSTTDRTTTAELLARIAAEEGELFQLSDEELSARYRVLQQKEARSAEVRAQLEELRRPFNLQGTAAEYEYWVKADLWTLDEAIALLLGKDPRKVTLALVKPCENVSAFARRYLDLRRLAERSALMHHGRTMVRQLDVARWVSDAKLDVPPGLLNAMQARHGEPAQQSQQSTLPTKGPSPTSAAHADAKPAEPSEGALASAEPAPAVELAPEANEAPPLEDWKMRVQAEAATHWRHLRTLGCNPTKHGMLNHLAKWCKANDVFLPGGSNPSEGSIKNRALVKWNPPR